MHGEIRLFSIHSKSTITAHSIEIQEMLPSPKHDYIINIVYSKKEEKNPKHKRRNKANEKR